MRDDRSVERAITHTAYAPVARAMGFTVYGLLDLCEALALPGEWRTIGVTRKDSHRVAAMVAENGRYVFSIGPNAFQLTENAREAQRIRNDVAEAIVAAIHRNRNAETRSTIAAAQRAVEKGQVIEAVSGPETMIIWPVAPRDPRGI